MVTPAALSFLPLTERVEVSILNRDLPSSRNNLPFFRSNPVSHDRSFIMPVNCGADMPGYSVKDITGFIFVGFRSTDYKVFLIMPGEPVF